MRYISSIIFLYSFVVLSCGANKQIYNALQSDSIVKGSNTISLTSSPFLTGERKFLNSDENENENISDLLTLLPESYILLEVIAVPLQTGDIDEYIILYAQNEDEPVSVMIAQYDEAKRYNFVWQRPTTSYGTESATFVEARDITGDYIKEIVVFGKDAHNKKVIDIFQRSDDTDIQSFQNIFSTQAEGIDLLESTKEQFKNEFAIFGYNYEIIILNSINGVFVREYFKWNETTQRIEKFLEERFSQEEITQQALSSLNNATNEDFKKFLSGAWYKEMPTYNQKNTSKQYTRIGIEFSDTPFGILFLLENDRGKKESYWYSWRSSFRNISRVGGVALNVSIKSNILPTIYDFIKIDIASEDKIHISTSTKTTIPRVISGVYHRITSMDTLWKGFNKEAHTKNNVYGSYVKEYLNVLQGQFINKKNNDTIIFDYPVVSFINNQGERRGLYSISSINESELIEIKMGENKALFYTIEQQEQNNTVVFLLTPKSIYSDAMFNNTQQDLIILERKSAVQ